MNISKLLLIDAALAIGVIPILFLLTGRDKISSLFGSSNKEKLLEKPSINLPEKKKILELEKNARSEGSGIELDSLVGNWRFISVWKEDSDNEDSIFSSLLRIFSAIIELKKEISPQNPLGLSISTSIKFGMLSINFYGSGYLKGKQPFLSFFFRFIEIKSGSSILLKRSIKQAKDKKKSFFELIALEKSEGWLAARGQGGALILWLKS